jgi:hypothetical protein
MSTAADPATGPEATAPTGTTGAVRVDRAAPLSDTPADRFMRRLLRLPEARTSTAAEARSAFQKSLLVSSARCLLMYIVFPFVLPAVGIAQGVGPAIGLVIGLLAMVSIVYSMRRFWRADHSKRWHYTGFGAVIIVFLVYLTVVDLTDLLS